MPSHVTKSATSSSTTVRTAVTRSRIQASTHLPVHLPLAHVSSIGEQARAFQSKEIYISPPWSPMASLLTVGVAAYLFIKSILTRRRTATGSPVAMQYTMGNVVGMAVVEDTTGHTWPHPKAKNCQCLEKLSTKPLVYEATASDPTVSPHLALPNISITTLNIQAPIHKRIPGDQREADDVQLYEARNRRILEMLLHDPPTIICLQEFWFCSESFTTLYHSVMRPAGYHMYITPRTNCRGDGLLTMVSSSRLDVLEHRHVPYLECGDRVAHLLRLQAKGARPGEQEFLLFNTHLMFPHDGNSHLIRLRQCLKLLAFIHQYTIENGLVHVPIVICGDWNGESDGCVFRFMQAQGFVSVYDECHKDEPRWVSHLNHRKQAVGVDYIWLFNPSLQQGTLAANWRELVCGCILAQLISHGVTNQDEAYDFFAVEGNEFFTPAEFVEGVQRLQLTGEEGIGLIDAEIEELSKYLDTNGDGIIDRNELHHTLDVEQALEILASVGGNVREFVLVYAATNAICHMPAPYRPMDLKIVSASLPDSFAQGVWPAGYEEEISDHAPLSAVLRLPDPRASRLPSSSNRQKSTSKA